MICAVVFEIISKWVKKKMDPVLQKYKGYLPEDWVDEQEPAPAAAQPVPVVVSSSSAIKPDAEKPAVGGSEGAA